MLTDTTYRVIEHAGRWAITDETGLVLDTDDSREALEAEAAEWNAERESERCEDVRDEITRLLNNCNDAALLDRIADLLADPDSRLSTSEPRRSPWTRSPNRRIRHAERSGDPARLSWYERDEAQRHIRLVEERETAYRDLSAWDDAFPGLPE